VLLLGGLAAAGWIGWTAKQAQQHLQASAEQLPGVREAWLRGDRGAGQAQLAVVQRESSAAFARTHDPVWAAAAQIPVLGSPAKTVRGLTQAVRDLSTVSLPQFASISAVSDPTTLISGPGRVNVAELKKLSPALQSAATSLAQEQYDVAELPPSWVPQVAQARRQLLAELRPVAQQAQSVSTAVQLVPSMLGGNGPRRYFVAFQNPAEARGTGGLLDAFAVVTADDGQIAVERVGSNAQLPDFTAQLPGLDADYEARYGGQGALGLWVSSNLSPDFPEVASTWASMWRSATGQRVDGVLTLDPAALSAVMQATGPVSSADVGSVDSARVTQLVVKDQYQLFPAGRLQNDERKSAMLGVGTAVIRSILSGQGDHRALLAGLTSAAKGDHISVFSADVAEQSLLESAGIAGQVPRTSGPFAQAVVVNSAGTKLDTYLRQSLDYTVTRCSSQQRAATVTVKLRNDAPVSGLPGYVTTWAEGTAVAPGANRLNLQVLLSRAAAVRTATLDGTALTLSPPLGELPKTLAGPKVQFLNQGLQAGRPSFGLDLDVLPGKTRTLVLTTTEPASSAKPLLPRQTLVNPPKVTSDLSACR
jgi:Protein of unknown function (DUF4012)